MSGKVWFQFLWTSNAIYDGTQNTGMRSVIVCAFHYSNRIGQTPGIPWTPKVKIVFILAWLFQGIEPGHLETLT